MFLTFSSSWFLNENPSHWTGLKEVWRFFNTPISMNRAEKKILEARQRSKMGDELKRGQSAASTRFQHESTAWNSGPAVSLKACRSRNERESRANAATVNSLRTCSAAGIRFNEGLRRERKHTLDQPPPPDGPVNSGVSSRLISFSTGPALAGSGRARLRTRPGSDPGPGSRG